MVLDYTSRLRHTRDSYKKPFKVGSGLSEMIDALHVFLPFFIQQRIWLQRMTAWKKNEVKPSRQLIDYAISKDPIGVNFDWERATDYYAGYSYNKLVVLLDFTESLVFHFLIILIDTTANPLTKNSSFVGDTKCDVSHYKREL